MWQRPQLLNIIADLLFAAGAAMLLAACALWTLRQPLAPIREVWFSTPLRHLARTDLEEAVQGHLRGNFLSVSLEDLRRALETVPWVRKASVRRVWPEHLVIRLEEHQPLAHWGDSGSEWVNSFGEVFTASLTTGPKPELPRLSGPPDSSKTLLRHYGMAVSAFAPLRMKPVRMTLSSRHALDMAFNTGLVLKLGREQPSAPIQNRLTRFIAAYPDAAGRRSQPPDVADLRYPNGFTLHPKPSRPSGDAERMNHE